MKKSLAKVLMHYNSANSLALFTREILANPRAMGAPCPSAPLLASCMASLVPIDRDGIILEVGGGTGAVTAALLKHGIQPSRLIVVERSPHLAVHLRQRFSQIQHIVQGDAAKLEQLLGSLNISNKVSSIVSSLPLRSLHLATTRAISEQFETVLDAGGLLIQFTYDLRGGNRTRFLHGFKRLSSKIIWGNLPPARVEVFERQV